MKEVTKHQVSYAILSESSVQREVENRELCTVPIPEWTFHRRIYLIRERNKLLSPAMEMFLERVVSQMI